MNHARANMQLVFVYGHAAAGKLTVARELAAQTGFALAAMPAAALTIDTTHTPPEVAASQIAAHLSRPT